MNPSVSGRSLTPTSTAWVSAWEATAGAAASPHREQGQVRGPTVTVTVTPGPGSSKVPLSSTLRLRRVTVPCPAGVQVYVQLSRPAARRQVVPPSTETSTAPTAPPESEAVPLMVTGLPAWTEAPARGA